MTSSVTGHTRRCGNGEDGVGVLATSRWVLGVNSLWEWLRQWEQPYLTRSHCPPLFFTTLLTLAFSFKNGLLFAWLRECYHCSLTPPLGSV